ncbi:glycosyltransferase family 2 protein, partial [Flavobacterium sp.]
MKSIAVVVLNWNGKTLLETFLPSVVKQSDLAQIYLVDNASTDDS